jgi:transcriptional regulator of acetoin/glycerol metabolism
MVLENIKAQVYAFPTRVDVAAHTAKSGRCLKHIGLTIKLETAMTAHDAVGDVDPLSVSPYLPIDDLSGGDATMDTLIAHGKRFIDRGLPILILGETGTGKEYLARALHLYSQRKRAAMVTVNCASIPDSLIESELFGYCKGAFSGALPGGMRGKVVQADKGTLFLDEIGDMPVAQQTRLLRVLSEKEVTPLGAAQPMPVDVQLICATHQDLLQQVDDGRFREDLYYRIAVGTLRLPALRERADLPALIHRMIRGEWPDAAPEKAIAADALAAMTGHAWPGNLRQLRAALSYACTVASDHFIRLADLPVELMRMPRRAVSPVQAAPEAGVVSPPVRLAEISALPVPRNVPPRSSLHAAARGPLSEDEERGEVLRALGETRWNISAAARHLGICRASLYRKLKSLQIPHLRDRSHELVDLPREPAVEYRRLSIVH